MEIEAQIEAFDVYGDVNVLESLSGGDVLKWDAIKATRYDDIFVKLCLNKTAKEYQKRYAAAMEAQRQRDANTK